MSYTVEDIKTVLWNTFNLDAEAIELTDENNGQYKFNVFPTDDISLETLSSMAEDLYDSDLFDVTMYRDHLEIIFLNPYMMAKESFTLLRENINTWISFDDKQVASLKKRFNMLNVKYHSNQFFKSIMKQLEEKKKLSKKQFDELKYLIDRGRTRYEDGILSTKN